VTDETLTAQRPAMAANPIPEAVRAQAAAWFAEYDKHNHFPEMLALDAYAAGHAAAQQLAEIEALRAEVERLQEAVRPKREDECLTLDHWRMRSYDLEANWSRCSRSCAGEQTKREQAEARAERLAEALRMMVEMVEMGGFGKAAAMDTARSALRDQEEGHEQ
jgi:DNA topoisomerase VI subunit B